MKRKKFRYKYKEASWGLVFRYTAKNFYFNDKKTGAQF